MSRLFDQRIGLTGARGANTPRVSTSVMACVMDGSLDSPFDGTSETSTRRNLTVIVKTAELAGIKPQIGDIVTLADGKRFAVKAVQPFYSRETILDVRSC